MDGPCIRLNAVGPNLTHATGMPGSTLPAGYPAPDCFPGFSADLHSRSHVRLISAGPECSLRQKLRVGD